MSSLDSALNSLSAATLHDFLSPVLPKHRLYDAARLCTLGWGIVMIAVGLTAGDWSRSVIEGINRVGALFYGPLLAAFACGLIDRRSTGPGVRLGVAAGLSCNVALWLGLGAELFWMWWNLSGLLVAALVTALGSRWPGRRVEPVVDSDLLLKPVWPGWMSMLLLPALGLGMLALLALTG